MHTAMLGIVGVIGAVIAGIVALIIHLSNMETADEKWAKEQEKLNKSMDDT